MVSFALWKLLTLIRCHPFIFVFIFITLGGESETILLKKKKYYWREQDGRGVGGFGVHLSPWIHQEYTFRHRNACRTQVQSGQEYLTKGQKYTEPYKTRYDEETRQGNGHVHRTGPVLSRWGN